VCIIEIVDKEPKFHKFQVNLKKSLGMKVILCDSCKWDCAAPAAILPAPMQHGAANIRTEEVEFDNQSLMYIRFSGFCRQFGLQNNLDSDNIFA
jgi:hypothetical protein